MKIKLIKLTRITHKAGDVVDVPGDVFAFLVSIGAGVPVEAEAPPEAKKKPKATKKTTKS